MPNENQGLPRGWGEITKDDRSSPSQVEEAPMSAPSLSTDTTEAFHLGNESKSFNIKKFLPILLIVLVLLVGGGLLYKFVFPQIKKVQKQSQKTTLIYWGLWEPKEVYAEVLADWEKSHPNIKIEYSQQSPKEYRERLQSALAQGKGPDLFRIHATWTSMFKDNLEGMPGSVMSGSTFQSTFYPVATTSLRQGEKIMAMPLMIDTLALFYNEDVFRLAGKTPPITWEDLRTTACDLTTRDETGVLQTSGIALGTTSNVDHWPDILGLMMLQNNADLGNPTGKLAEDALSWYSLFQSSRACESGKVWDSTLPNSTMAFASGRLAMYLGFSWDVFEIKAINPDLNFKIVPAPRLAEENIAWASFWVEGVSKQSANKDAAWEFLKYLSKSETMEKLYQSQARLRLFGEIYPRVDMAGKLSSDPLVSPFLSQAAKAQTWYLASRTFDNNGINDRIIKYYEDAVNASSTGSSPAEALRTTASGVSQVLSQYGIGSRIVP